eukprot:360341-Chlamydomonas_euryale.AAC.5
MQISLRQPSGSDGMGVAIITKELQRKKKRGNGQQRARRTRKRGREKDRSGQGKRNDDARSVCTHN